MHAIIVPLVLFMALQSRGEDSKAKSETPEQMSARFAAIPEHNRRVFALRYWGDRVMAQVERVKVVPKVKPKDQPNAVTGFVWPITKPTVYDLYTVDVARKTMSKLVLPGLKEVIRLSMDGSARVAFGYNEKGEATLLREQVETWEKLPLPREFLQASQRILVQSDTTLALMTPATIHIWEKNRWRTTPLPAMPNDSLNRPRPIEWAVLPTGRQFGRNFYVGWQETEINGCLMTIDLLAEQPRWRDINGVGDPAVGLPKSWLVAAVRQGPNQHLWVAQDGEYMGEEVYRFNGKTWESFWKGPKLSHYLLLDMSIGPKEECYLLSARPPAQVLRVAGDRTETILTIPGMATSILADRQGNVLVGTAGYDLILYEKVDNGFRLHHVTPPP